MVNTKTLKQKMMLLFVGVFLASFVMSVMPAPKAAADGMDGSFISSKVSGQVLDHQLLFFLERCFLLKDMDKVTSSELNSWEWFKGGDINSNINFGSARGLSTSVRGGMYDVVAPGCDDGQYIKEAFGRFGLTDALDTFCSLSFTYSRETGGNGKTVNGGSTAAACKNGYNKGDFDGSGDQKGQLSALQSLLSAHSPYSVAKAPLLSYQEYVRYYRTFMKGCNIGLLNPYETGSASNQSNLFKVAVVNQDGTVAYYLGQSSGGKNGDTSVPLVAKLTYGEPPYQSVTCGDLAVALRPASEGGKGYADAYATYLKTTGANDTTDQSSGATNEQTAEPTSCAVDGIGWIICPVMGFIAKVNDSAFSFLQSFLGIRPSLINSDGTIKAWQAFRDIANVAFVIAFLVIVYSQLTSAGISNYGIKKMLPRIVIAAILVNLSYYICAVMVDVSNILGSSIYSLLKSFDVGASASDPSWQTMISGPSGILATAATGIAVVLLAVAVFLAPTTLLAFAVVILILIARQAFVILLLVISPLAFVAYLLPNTEDWFKKWWKALTATLMVYPIIGAVFGASTLAANILSSTAGSTDDSSLLQLIALGVLAVPLFAVPALLKGSLSAAGSVGQKLAGLQDRANRRGLRSIKEGRIGEAKAAWDRSRQNNRFKRRTGQGKLATWGENRGGAIGGAAAWIGTRQKAFDSSSVGARLGGTRGAAVATQGIFKQYDEDVAAFKTTMSGKSNEALVEMIKDSSLSSEQRAAAAGMVMSRDHREAHLQALHAVGQATRAAEAAGNTSELGTLSDVQKQMSHDMKDKPWALGDQAAGQLVEGVYGRTVNHEGKSQQQFGDINEEIKDRIGKKLSAASIAKMNPDEMNHIMDSALGNELNDEQLTKLAESINAARANPQMNDLIKAQEAKKHQAILDYIAQNHPTIPLTPPAPIPPSTPPPTPPTP